MLKKYLRLLLGRFINVSDKPKLGTLDLSRMTTQEYPFNSVGVYNSASITVPFSGLVIFSMQFDVTDCCIRKIDWGDFVRTGIPGDSQGRWQGLSLEVEKGETLLFEAFIKSTGTAVIKFIPYKNT